MEEKLSVVNKTKSKMPILPISSIKKEILGKDYSLSVAYVPLKTSRIINKAYRSKDRPTNVLSFPFDKKSGELVLCPGLIRKETAKFGRNFRELLGFLVIHGMLHLKGMRHSSKMERAEIIYDQKYFGGN